ncbi:hypothetical protein H5410_042591 [Solanum commersonii]|uniref:Uncharacterized protein n=1 Tax=Solanum commersonii TaxID=4109 RepID=A0A9J5XW43_SOLCO|nr:hypothetical protein H5410_042591 [Solanum commersonii]
MALSSFVGTIWLKLEEALLNDLFISLLKARKERRKKFQDLHKKKKIVVEEPKTNSDSDTVDEIDNYEDSSAQNTDDVESSEEKTDSGDEESSRDSQDTGDEDDDPLSLPFCAREISDKSYNLTT